MRPRLEIRKCQYVAHCCLTENIIIIEFTCALHVSGFPLAHLQRQVYNFGSGLSLLGMVLAPGH
jgi:hypothetical protein